MKIDKALMILTIAAFFVSGCSDKQKDSEQIEQDVTDLAAESAMFDTTESVLDTSMIEDESEFAEEPDLEMPRAPQGDGYVVQVSSATDESYAFYLVDLWRERGYEPYVTTITYNDEPYFRVRIGLFDAYSEAKKLVAELEDKYSANAWIDQVSY